MNHSPLLMTPAPLDYRYALDAGMSVLAGKTPLMVRCNARELSGEVHQRIRPGAEPDVASAALWVEPLIDSWPAELQTFSDALPGGAPLVIVASRPLARWLPERRSWQEQALGLQLGGLSQLHRELGRAGFVLEAIYGIHSAFAIGLNVLSRQAEQWGRPDLSDRLHFAARLHYCTTGPLAMLSTLALLITRKDSCRC